MSPRSKMLCTLILIITFSTAFCYDDDDDDIISEIVFDLLAGVMIEECGKYQTCKMFMHHIVRVRQIILVRELINFNMLLNSLKIQKQEHHGVLLCLHGILVN